MKPWSLPTIQNQSKPEEIARFATQGLTNISQLLTGNLDFLNNFLCDIKTDITIETTETAIEHDLKIVPIGYILIKNNTYCLIRTASTPWSSKFIYLQADTSTVVSIIILGG